MVLLRKSTSPILIVLFASTSLLTVFAAPTGVVHTSITAVYTVCASGCDFSSIQTAIDTVDPGDTLSLAGETFTEPFTVTKSLIFQGTGAGDTILQAAAAPGTATSRVIAINSGVTVTISGVTIRYGKETSGVVPDGYGGGILNEGTLSLQHSVVQSNTAELGGGGLYNRGNSLATISNTVFLGNSAQTGGGIHSYNNGMLHVLDSSFEGNIAENSGGGIANDRESTLTVSNSTFKGNSADGGGAIYNVWDSAVTITGCSFLFNHASIRGGGINNREQMTITKSIFEGNDADEGGGISNSPYAGLRVLDAEFRRNFAAHGAGIYNYNNSNLDILDTTFFSNTAQYNGGGIYNRLFSTANITATTFYSNSTSSTGYGGGIYSSEGSTLTVSNSTFSGNSAGKSGGGIHNNYVSTLNASNVTFDGNSANENGGGICNRYFSVLNLSGSILAGSLSGGDCYNESGNEYGIVFDLGYNLVEDGLCIYDPTSFADDPLLGPLQDNGGDTFTHALLEGSPAVDVIPTEACTVTVDQRGVVRPQGPACDIGSFEVVSTEFVYEVFLPLVVKN